MIPQRVARGRAVQLAHGAPQRGGVTQPPRAQLETDQRRDFRRHRHHARRGDRGRLHARVQRAVHLPTLRPFARIAGQVAHERIVEAQRGGTGVVGRWHDDGRASRRVSSPV